MHAWIARRLGSSACTSASVVVKGASHTSKSRSLVNRGSRTVHKTYLYRHTPIRSTQFGIRPFATWTDAEVSPSSLVDHFPQGSSLASHSFLFLISNSIALGLTHSVSIVPTPKLLSQIKSRFLDFQPLNATDKKVLKLYSDTLALRAEQGDSDASLTILLSVIKDKEDDSAITDAVSWLEEACKDEKNLEAMYFYALYLSTGEFSEKAEHYMGQVPDEPYYIDIDNLDSFLGLDQGVSPEGSLTEKQFDFKAWLRAERTRRLAERASPLGSTSSDATAEKLSCSTKRTLNFEKAVLLLEKCHDAGHTKAGVTLYLLTKDTPGASKYSAENLIESFKKTKNGLGLLRASEATADSLLLEAAASTNYAPAVYQLAQIYHDSESDAHYLKFLELMNVAAELGNRDAQYMAGKIEEAKGQEAVAFSWLSMAASLPNPSQYACFDLGVVYHQGTLGQAKDLKLAAKYWKIGGRLGHPDCLVNLASMYYLGYGVEKNFEKSFYLNQNASVLGSSIANQNLSMMYSQGLGVPQSHEMARYYLKLAEGGETSAEALLEALGGSAEQAKTQ